MDQTRNTTTTRRRGDRPTSPQDQPRRGDGFAPVPRATAILVLMIGVGPWYGCATTSRSIFDPHEPPLAWPSVDATPRVAYVGQLRAAGDLKPRQTPFETIGKWVFGEEAAVELRGPQAVLPLADEGLVWIADPGQRSLHLFDLKRRRHTLISTVAGNQLLAPVGLCDGPGDSIFVCDAEAGAVYQLDKRTGEALAEISLPEILSRPVAMYFDHNANELFIVDAVGHDIKVVSASGRLIRVIGRRGTALGEFNYPVAITESEGLLWIADAGNHRVQAITKKGEPRHWFGRNGDSPGDFALVKALALDRAGHVYVVDSRFENIQVFDQTGKLLLFFGGEGRGRGEFWLPAGIAIDSSDRIWICDSYNRRVQVFDYIDSSKQALEINDEED